jgi:hypothetical protein
LLPGELQMTTEGPPIQVLTRRLSECPSEFLEEPAQLNVAAVVSDAIKELGGDSMTPGSAGAFSFDPARNAYQERNRLQLVLISCWLLHDQWFRSRAKFARQCVKFLGDHVPELAKVISAQKFISDPDRREELARMFLDALDLRPLGETDEQANDRLTTLSSTERQRVIQESRAAEQRAREVREAMAKKAAEEAASTYGRE